MQIHPVRTEQEHRAAVARIADLMGAVEGSPAGDELDVLATLVDAYESKHFVMDAPTPTAAILFRMDQQHLSRKDLEPAIGSRARVSEVLTGKRALTLQMIRRLRETLGVSADLLIASAVRPAERHRTVPKPALGGPVVSRKKKVEPVNASQKKPRTIRAV